MPERPEITEDQLHGFDYFKKLPPLSQRLRDHATGRDKAGIAANAAAQRPRNPSVPDSSCLV
ncbi:MAG: hypothetical protein ABSH20_09675 [Tepidisphaeraceae bacterium]